MHENTPPNLPWLDRLAMSIPGYGGYHQRAQRRSADRALRDAVAQKLGAAHRQIEQAVRQCIDRNALTEINALERVGRHLDRVAERVRSAGSGDDSFYHAGDLDHAKAEYLHQVDMELYSKADGLLRRFDESDDHHDRLAHFESDLKYLEQLLDERALRLQHVH